MADNRLIVRIKNEKRPEPQMIMELSLEWYGQNSVILSGVDRLQRRFSIARIDGDGLRLIGGLPTDVGWPVDPITETIRMVK